MKVELNELTNVSGIGKKTIQRIREYKLKQDNYISKYNPELHLERNSVNQGDCLKLMNGIPDKSVDMILADLPYTFEGKNRVTGNSWDTGIAIDLLWEQYKRIIKEKGAIVLTASNPFASYLIMSNKNMFKYEWIWEKDNGSNFVHVNHQPFKVHEQILVFGEAPTTYNVNEKYMKYNPQFTYGEPYTMKRDMSDMDNLEGFGGRTDTVNEVGKRYPRTVQKINLERGLHPTQKPVKLFEYLIKTYTNKGDLVLDNVAGSGTTGVACQNTNRDYILIEQEEKYIDIIKDRLRGGDTNAKNSNNR